MSLPRKSIVSNIPSFSGYLRIHLIILDTLNDASGLINMTFNLRELSHDSVVHSIKSTHVTLDSVDSPHCAIKRA